MVMPKPRDPADLRTCWCCPSLGIDLLGMASGPGADLLVMMSRYNV